MPLSADIITVNPDGYTFDDSPRISRTVSVNAHGITCGIRTDAKFERPTTLKGPDVCQLPEFFGSDVPQLPPSERSNGIWDCESTAVGNRDTGEYAYCQVEVTFDPDDGDTETNSRLFLPGTLNEGHCREWCLALWPTSALEPFDRLYRCSGKHADYDDHPAYVPPSSAKN